MHVSNRQLRTEFDNWLAGIQKKSVALALRESRMNDRSRQADIGGTG